MHNRLRFIPIILALLLLMETPVFAFPPELSEEAEASVVETVEEDFSRTVRGDVNGDGRLTAADARLTLRASARMERLSAYAFAEADFDGNGVITAKDARCLLRLSAKLDPTAPVTTRPTTTTKPTTTAPTTTKPPATQRTAYTRKYTVSLDSAFYTDYAPAAALYDYNNDKILYGRNMNEYMEPASTTKLMTAFVSSKYLGENTVIRVGDELDLVNWNASTAGLYKGLRMTYAEMLKCLLLPSGCDAAYAIACAAGRAAAKDSSLSPWNAVRRFVGLMNEEAKKLGMTRTTWTNPDGFPDDSGRPWTTARDMLVLATACYDVAIIRRTSGSPKANVYDADGDYFAYYDNTNELLWQNSDRYYQYCVGMKTGSHSTAGQCLVTAVRKDQRIFLCVVMGCDSKWSRFMAIKGLCDTAFARYS